MAEHGNLEDAIPIKKTSSAVYIGVGVGVLVILGLIFALSGGDDVAKKEEAAETEKAADAAQGMTKAEAEERVAHIKKTQAALLAAEQEENAEAAAHKASADAKKAEAENQAEEAPKSAGSKSPSAAPKPKPAVDKNKTLDSLDGLGSDIADALK